MPTPTRRRLLASALPLLLLPALARARPEPVLVEGQPFARRVRLAGAELQLNGTGVRAVAWFKGYAAGLYLAGRADTATQAVAMPGPKRLQLRMLQEVPAAEFVKAFNKGMLRNAAPEAAATLGERMARFEALIAQGGSVRPGDVVDLDFDPARGMQYVYNGKPRGEPIPGEDFYGTLLRAFVGERPYDKALRAGLLGQ